MKKYCLLVFALLLFTKLGAQIPEFINYQAVLRDASGASLPPGTSGTIVFKLYDNLTASSASYEESHNFTINNSGIVNLKIGQGTPIGSNTFPNNVNWFGGEVCYEVFFKGNIVGNRQAFASVPYAIYAKRSEGDLPQGIANQTIYWDNTINKWRATSNLSNNGSNVNIGPALTGPGNKLLVSTLSTSDTTAILASKLSANGRDAGIRSYIDGSTNSNSADFNQALFGIQGYGSNTGTGPAMGILGVGRSQGYGYGLTGLASAGSNTAFAIGVYGGIITNTINSPNVWAGYMDGNLFIKDSLFLGGVTNPGNAGDVLMRTTTGKARWQTLNSSNPINLFSNGISSVSPTGPSTSFTINTPAPTFSSTGLGAISGSYPNYLLNVPAASLSVIGNSITLTQGSVAVTQTVGSLFGNGVAGYIPTYSGAGTMSVSNIFRNALNNRIGIGTTNPATMLHLQKNGTDTLLLESTSATQGMGIGLKQTTNRYNLSINAGRFVIDQNNTERLVISNGNIGLGVTSPLFPLDVINTNSIGIRYTSSNINGAFYQVNFTSAAGNAGYSYLQNGNPLASHFATPLGDWVLNVNNVNRINVIGANGNVGIGVATPNNKLHVALGDVNIDLNQGYKIGNEFVLYRDAASVYLGSNLFTPTIIRAGTEKMRVLTNGNVGIGTSTPNGLLTVNGNVFVPAASDYRYITGKTKYYKVSCFEMNSANPALYSERIDDGFQATVVNGLNSLWATGGAAGVPAYFVAPVHLPDSAVITGLSARVVKNGGTLQSVVELYRTDGGGYLANNAELIATCSTSFSGGSVQFISAGSVNPAFNVVNNQIYSYFIRYIGEQNTQNLRFHQATVTYQIFKTE